MPAALTLRELTAHLTAASEAHEAPSLAGARSDREPLPASSRGRLTGFDWIALGTVVAVAALLRLPGIEARGQFDADQGHDMLTLLAFVRDGEIPLLGPRTSVGEFHHGAFYYFLLAPAAALSNADPVAVTTFLALLGIGAVALTWWLARAIAGGAAGSTPGSGSMAGFLAGLLLAVSPAAIAESTFIWNPNPIGFFAVAALASAWRARSGGSGAWWSVALGCAAAVAQLHVLGVVFLVAIIAIALLALRGARPRAAFAGLVGGVLLMLLLFVPLLVHEITNDFLETRRVLDYIGGGDDPIAPNPIVAILFTLLRVVAWPIVGLVTEVWALAAIVLALVVGLTVIGLRILRGAAAVGYAWLVGIGLWSTLALSFAAPSLQRVVPGLPNDHYHAFLDPVVVMLIAIPAAELYRRAVDAWSKTRRPITLAGVASIAALLATVVAVADLRKPPPVDPDGGWPAARSAGERILQRVDGVPATIVSLPDFKNADGIVFPVRYAAARSGGAATSTPVIVIVCDRLFEAAIGARCGGPAEDRFISESGAARGIALVDRFDASSRTSISIYRSVDPP